VSQEYISKDDGCAAFAAKMRCALGPENSFQLNRLAFEDYDFAQDVIRLNDLADTSEEFGEMFRPF
jgi:hypothetical protein